MAIADKPLKTIASKAGSRRAVATTLPTKLTRAQDWARFGRRLARTLAEMKPVQFLIIHQRERSADWRNVYVQFVREKDRSIHAEAVSNEYLGRNYRLKKDQIKALREIGWEPPRHPAEQAHLGSPNFYIDANAPMDHARLADAAVRALRDVYRTRRPSSMTCYGFAKRKGYDEFIDFPRLGLNA